MKQLLSEQDKKHLDFWDTFPKISFVISIVLAVAMLMSCKNDIEVINLLTNINNLPSLTIVNLETIYTDSTKIQLRIKAPLVKRYDHEEDPYLEFPKGLKVYFYDENEKVESQLSARYAIYYEAEELWEAKDSVVATNDRGEVLNTEQLFWDENKKLIYTSEFVKITSSDEIIYGDGMEANENFTDWKIMKPRGTFYIENGN
ncbi:MAG: LPS export ABC transporter periplasmic protein LptC [Bacteroidetes bacterium]|nr:LPS export ABC transporter periplasmic protein LptC [Bacteroidota bacterium]